MPAKIRRKPTPRVITDPRAMRALAHPARLAVLEALADGAELTATECAEATGLSPSAMSYHLRALEKWGFVERATGSDGRERPWRAVPGGWTIDGLATPAAASAGTEVITSMLNRIQADIARWFERERDQPAAWRHATWIEDRVVWLTVDEATELQTRYTDFVDSIRGRTARDHPEGARRVRAARIVVPLQFD